MMRRRICWQRGIFSVGLFCAAGMSGQAHAEGSFLEGLIGGATYELTAIGSAFPKTIRNPGQMEHDRYESWSHLTVTGKEFIGENWAFDVRLETGVSTYQGEERGVFTAPGSRSGQARYLDVSQLSLAYLGESGEILAGKAGLESGLAELYSPTDLYSRSNLSNPLHPVDQGVWQIRGDLYFGADRMTVVVLPVDEAAPSVPYRSRWVGKSGDSSFSSLNIPGVPSWVSIKTEDDYRGSHPAEWGYLLRYQGVGEGVDYFVSGYVGPSPYPVLKTQNLLEGRFIKERPQVAIASGGFAVTEGGWKFYGEGLSYRAPGGKDDAFIRGLIGAKYRETELADWLGLDEISPVLEYSNEWIGDTQSHPQYGSSSRTARPNPSNLLANLEFKVDSQWTFGGGYNRNMRDDDETRSIFVRYQPQDSLSLLLSGTDFRGRSDTRFGRHADNDVIEMSVTYKF